MGKRGVRRKSLPITTEERKKKEWLKKYGSGWKEYDSTAYECHIKEEKEIEECEKIRQIYLNFFEE